MAKAISALLISMACLSLWERCPEGAERGKSPLSHSLRCTSALLGRTEWRDAVIRRVARLVYPAEWRDAVISRVSRLVCILLPLWGSKIKVSLPSRPAAIHCPPDSGIENFESRTLRKEKSRDSICYLCFFGPSGETRTRGILLPKQARYQLRYTRKGYHVF